MLKLEDKKIHNFTPKFFGLSGLISQFVLLPYHLQHLLVAALSGLILFASVEKI